MSQRVIPLTAVTAHHRSAAIPEPLAAPTGRVLDTRGRAMHDLRISVTDRCNFRCTYCMPREVFDRNYPYAAHDALLSFEEITRLARLFVAHGVNKIRLTGGEPLLRRNVEVLVAMLAELRCVNGSPIDLTLTTNGSLLAKKAAALRAAGLARLTVSLDALDDELFRRMNDADFPVSAVLEGIDAARDAGFPDIKVNMVVQRGVNDREIVAMARHFRGSGQIVRFIEYMDVGASNGWRLDQVVPSREVLERIDAEFAIEPIDANYPGEVAQRWRYADGSGEIGVISSVTQAFCSSCTRARLSTEGRLYTCLFAAAGTELREMLRSGASDLEIAGAIGLVWTERADNYSETRSALTSARPKIEMSYIGG